jgi:hypothetical protein
MKIKTLLLLEKRGMILTHKFAIRSENVKGHVLAESVSTGCRARTTSYAATKKFTEIW